MGMDWKASLSIVVILAGMGAAIWYVTSQKEATAPVSETVSPSEMPAEGIQAVFTCEGGKTITAVFSDNQVGLSLSDGRQVILPRAISASGARYANPDESFVFWNKGDTAFIEEFGKQTYASCVTQG